MQFEVILLKNTDFNKNFVDSTHLIYIVFEAGPMCEL